MKRTRSQGEFWCSLSLFANSNIVFYSLTIEGDAKFHAVRGCARCKMTTIDMEAGKAPPSLNVEPLVTLNEYRKLGDDVYFGQNLIAEVKNIGKDVKVGDKFEFEKRPAKSPKIIV
mmetsp:Transcript_14038/g.24870  ORF Transcript_14038/g.24870 Transcript_14038/m.24870 type:complete len:116 (-) Transcript_14038:1115-1462(-)